MSPRAQGEFGEEPLGGPLSHLPGRGEGCGHRGQKRWKGVGGWGQDPGEGAGQPLSRALSPRNTDAPGVDSPAEGHSPRGKGC